MKREIKELPYPMTNLNIGDELSFDGVYVNGYQHDTSPISELVREAFYLNDEESAITAQGVYARLDNNKVVLLGFIENGVFEELQKEWNIDQRKKANDWYDSHKDHVNNLVKETRNYYPPTETEDINNPALWKANHWGWFLNN